MTLLKAVLEAFLFFLFSGIIHVILTRKKGRSGFVKYSLMLGVGIAFCFFILLLSTGEAGFAILATYLFVASWFLWIVFFVNLLNSVSLQMMAIIREKGSVTSLEDLNRQLPDQLGIEGRIEAILNNGFLIRKNDMLILTRKGNVATFVFSMIESWLGFKSL